ncbi:MAG: tetratricopeptide repeat protein [Acidobacteria bacterium]|nr:tetratricopeptide repeat protein [Acidobacteriota bacterium]MBV9476556.1 tetratricopeptide repeat protein [Acidobacteriota bacterium]
MKILKASSLVLLAALLVPAVARAQEFPAEPYEFLQAKLAAEEGHFDEALKILDRIIEKNAADPVLRYERAMVLIDAGNVARAETELRAVVKTNPDFYDANRVLGRLLLDRSNNDRTKVDEALGYLQAAFKANPDDLSTGLAVTQILTSAGRNADAERVMATMLERAPDQRALNYNYALILTKLGRGNESRQYLERALAADPTFSPAIQQLLEIYQQQNDWGKAAETLQPLIEEDPMNLDLQRQQAVFYLRAGDAEKARDRFKTLAAADPKDTRSQYYLAESLNDLEEYAESEKIFRQLLAATPNDADLLASFGLSLTGQKKWDDAAKTFNALLAVQDVPENLAALARTQLAYIDLQKGNYEAAYATAKAVLTFGNKPNPQAVNIALEALKKLNRGNDAVALLQPLATTYDSDPFIAARTIEALSRANQKPVAQRLALTQVKLGTRNAIAATEAYVQAGDSTAAIALMKYATDAKPDDLDLLFELGSVYERAGDRKSAEATFLEVLKKNPEHAPTLNYLGYMWAESGVNLDRAHDMLSRAVTQEPNNGAYVDSLGWVYFRLGQLDLAEKYLTDAAKLLPRDATVHEHLGDVLAKRGDAERALQLYRTAITLDPDAKEVEKIRSKIAELEHRNQTSQR